MRVEHEQFAIWLGFGRRASGNTSTDEDSGSSYDEDVDTKPAPVLKDEKKKKRKKVSETSITYAIVEHEHPTTEAKPDCELSTVRQPKPSQLRYAVRNLAWLRLSCEW
eukprot:scaffold167453_cov36-Cyclotella_meneghiniana.AAC.1